MINFDNMEKMVKKDDESKKDRTEFDYDAGSMNNEYIEYIDSMKKHKATTEEAFRKRVVGEFVELEQKEPDNIKTVMAGTPSVSSFFRVEPERTDLADQLKQNFKFLRKDKPEQEREFDKPLREADFCHEICGSFCAKFSDEYVTRLTRILGGSAKIYVQNNMSKTCASSHHKDGCHYMTMNEVDFILGEIESYIELGEWRQPE